ncbi:MAG: hypothetical protein N2515_00470 [Deltaproteobacteria bacterium]|nr:hypothetical protein [Deltaproteobacteria bacterium]
MWLKLALLFGCLLLGCGGNSPDLDAGPSRDARASEGGRDVSAIDAPDSTIGEDAPSPADSGADAVRDAPISSLDTGQDTPSTPDAGPGRETDAFSTEDAFRWRVHFCRLQYPLGADLRLKDTLTVYGRVYVEGLTDRTQMNDPDPLLIAELGWGPVDSDPATSTSWRWIRAAPNPGYGPGSPSHEPNNDEYQATLTAEMVGIYNYAYRFSGDGGRTYLYCDGQDAGSSDGYQPANAGRLTVGM